MILFGLIPLLFLFIELISLRKLSRKTWGFGLLFFSISLAYAYGSRCVGCAIYDDYANVYLFQGKYLDEFGFNQFSEQSIAVTHEKIFYIIYWIVANLLNEKYWLFGLSLITISILSFSLRNHIKDSYILLIVGISSIGLSTQLIRQYMAWVIVLFIYLKFKHKIKHYFILFIIPIFVHTSSLFFILKIWLSEKKSKLVITYILILFSILYLTKNYFFALDFEFINFIQSESLEPDILDYSKSFLSRFILLLFFALYFDIIKKYVLISFFVFLILLNFPLVSVRFNLLLASHAFGIILVLIIDKQNIFPKNVLVFIFLLLIYLRLIFNNNNNDFELWKSYNMIF